MNIDYHIEVERHYYSVPCPPAKAFVAIYHTADLEQIKLKETIMLIHPIVEKLQTMRFYGMRKAFEEQLQMADLDKLPFEEYDGSHPLDRFLMGLSSKPVSLFSTTSVRLSAGSTEGALRFPGVDPAGA